MCKAGSSCHAWLSPGETICRDSKLFLKITSSSCYPYSSDENDEVLTKRVSQSHSIYANCLLTS